MVGNVGIEIPPGTLLTRFLHKYIFIYITLNERECEDTTSNGVKSSSKHFRLLNDPATYLAPAFTDGKSAITK